MANELATKIMHHLSNQPELELDVEEGINAAWNNIFQVVEFVTDEFLDELNSSQKVRQ